MIATLRMFSLPMYSSFYKGAYGPLAVCEMAPEKASEVSGEGLSLLGG